MLASALSGLAGHRRGSRRLFLEARDAPAVVHLHHAQAAGVGERHLDAARSTCAPAPDVLRQHLAVIHLVDVVAGEHQHVVRRVAAQDVEVLVHRVGGAALPVARRCAAAPAAAPRIRRSARRESSSRAARGGSGCAPCTACRSPMRRMPELTQLESVKSMMRNLPPKGTAGFARHSVSCSSRLPRPPARTSAMVLRVMSLTSRLSSFSICQDNPDAGIGEVGARHGPASGEPGSARPLGITLRITRVIPGRELGPGTEPGREAQLAHVAEPHAGFTV